MRVALLSFALTRVVKTLFATGDHKRSRDFFGRGKRSGVGPLRAFGQSRGHEKRAPGGRPSFFETFDGQGRSRTADTAIFSRVLYQLSYLAVNLLTRTEGRV